jgi:hypothetical protein
VKSFNEGQGQDENEGLAMIQSDQDRLGNVHLIFTN